MKHSTLNLLKQNLLTAIKGIALALAFCAVFITVLTFAGCESEVAPISQGKFTLPEGLPVERNFSLSPAEKGETIWTEADFKQAEAQVEPRDVDYLAPNLSVPPPDALTAEDIALINAHTQAKFNRLQAGANSQNFAKKE